MNFIDGKCIQRLKEELDFEKFINACKKASILEKGQQMHFNLDWPAFLGSIDLGSIFESFPKFDHTNKLFALLISNLVLESRNDLIIRLYDQVFVECLTEVKALPQMNPAYLIGKILEKRQSLTSESSNILAEPLERYEILFERNPSSIMHDLVLYLAWDRVCVRLAIIFEYNFPDQKIPKGMQVLKECLKESFQHITGQGKTRPSFFRLAEAMYAFYMREENLKSHTESEWLVLCQGAKVLTFREDLADVCYVDAAIKNLHGKNSEVEPLHFFTMDSIEKVNARLTLSRFILEKFKQDESEWHYVFSSSEIVCVKKSSGLLAIDNISISN
jgi:hypothetical protein